VVGAAASGAAVAAIDSVDNDDNVTGIGDDVAYDHSDDDDLDETSQYATTAADPNYAANTYAGAGATGGAAGTMGYENVPSTTGGWTNDAPGIQTGGQTLEGGPDTRGIGEKAADAVTGDRYDDKTGQRVP
jgi:hypothetical protein